MKISFEQKIEKMMELQDKANTATIGENWTEAGKEWYRAAQVECAELMDHYGWKWWKAQKTDWEQAHLELVDIWHFGLSICILTNESVQSIALAAEQLQDDSVTPDGDSEHIRQLIEELHASLLRNRNGVFSYGLFFHLCTQLGLSFDELFGQYVGKNVLNIFRQKHGYKSGDYFREWSGRDDNEHLVEVLGEVDLASKTVEQDIEDALEARYQNHLEELHDAATEHED